MNLEREKLEALINADASGACGIAAIQSTRGATREVVDLLLESLCRNDIRGGVIQEKKGLPTGDGAGINVRTDNDSRGRGMQEFLHSQVGREVPLTKPREQLHGALFFIDTEQQPNAEIIGDRVRFILAEQGLRTLAWRKVFTDPSAVSARARAIMPLVYELVFAEGDIPREELRRSLFDARLRIKNELADTHPVSIQPGTMTWKAMCRGRDLANFYPDLKDPRFVTDGGLSHTRYGTNVLAHWLLAQPFDEIAHNGEVNSNRVMLEMLHILERRESLQGTNIMRGGSDSANLDRVIQMLHARAGLSLPEAVRYILHPANDDLARLDPDFQDYFQALARVFGPLRAVGPIALLGIDRDHITATLDNMGLRPLRWVQRDDGLVVLSSEVGSPRIESKRIGEYGKLGPGEHLFIDRTGTMHKPGQADREIVSGTRLNFRQFAAPEISPLTIEGREKRSPDSQTRIRRAHLFGLNRHRREALRQTLEAKKDPVDGMGSDLALPILVDEPHSMGRYLKPDYSQVTNPSLDPVRSRSTFSTTTYLGRKPKKRHFGLEYEARAQIVLSDPLLDDTQIAALLATPEGVRPGVKTISTVFERNGEGGFQARLSEIKQQVLECAEERTHSIIILSDTEATGEGDGYIPPHLLVSYLNRVLANQGLSEFVSLVCDTGEVLDQHEFATLIASGAAAIHPRMIYEFIDAEELGKGDPQALRAALREAFQFTLLRYMSKLGETDIDNYRNGRQFSTVGLDSDFVNRFFGNIQTNGGGVGLDKILADQARRADLDTKTLRGEEEKHAWAKAVWKALQEVGESETMSPAEAYEKYRQEIDRLGPMSFHDFFRFKMTDDNGKSRKPIPLEEVMSPKEIIQRILKGASMSLGALNTQSWKAVQLLFNSYGSEAGSGEGGISPDTRMGEKWEFATSKARQIASGRFGVDIEFLADPRVTVIEIKIGQGAKPGVGGHLPGEKVSELIAEVRGVSLGQELVSPPTNHNIYSIEDLAAFIQHLKACNPVAKICVKLTAGSNGGNIAVGCVKAGADKIQISGEQGGTGAATYTDKFRTGLSREWGVAAVHRALVERGLRYKKTIGSDGGIRTGRDVVMDLICGANEAHLGALILTVQQKCIQCNKCATQGCPSDICRTRSAFLGSLKGRNRISYPEDEQMERLLRAGSNFLEQMAGEIRGYMAQLGIRDIDEFVGRKNLIEIDPRYRAISDQLDLRIFLETPEPVFRESPSAPSLIERVRDTFRRTTETVLRPTHHDPGHLDYYLNNYAVNEPNRQIIRAIRDSDGGKDPVRIPLNLQTEHRSVGATACGLRVKGILKFPEGGVIVNSSGEAGQGYAYALGEGLTMRHRGVVQNETAEVQSGGRVIVMPPADSPLLRRNNLALVGNTLRYGARGGDAFIQASIGDRGCIRETGGRTIITGNVGKNFGEYKTGGRDIILGESSGEMGAGMSGGHIYVRDQEIARKLSRDVMIPMVLRRRDLEIIHRDLQDFYLETGDPEVGGILAHWGKAKTDFRKVVAKGQYATGVFEYLYSKVGGKPHPDIRHGELLANLFELFGYDIDMETNGVIPEEVQAGLDHGVSELRDALATLARANKKPLEPEEIFIRSRGFATVLTDKLNQEFRHSEKGKGSITLQGIPTAVV